jgi:hypothetical protein
MTQDDGNGSIGEARMDRRRFDRVAVSLPGRYMLEDGSEHDCVCVDVSVGGVRLRAPQSGPWGSRVIAYIEAIGRLEGYVVRRAPGWFALETRGTALKGERVQERIAMILKAQADDYVDRRGPSRPFSNRQSPHRQVSLGTLDGRLHHAEITDISKNGAALLTEAPLSLDERVRLDSRRARVARLFPGGAALKFENWTDEQRARREPALAEPRARRA